MGHYFIDDHFINVIIYVAYMAFGVVLGSLAHRLGAMKTSVLFGLAVSAAVIASATWPYGVRGFRGFVYWFLEGFFWVGGPAIVFLGVPFAVGFLSTCVARRVQARRSGGEAGNSGVGRNPPVG